MEKKVKALFVGLNTVDIQFFVKGYPKSNTKTKARKNEIATGGPATNASITAACLGAETTLITPIGKHSFSQFIKSDIKSHQVNIIDPMENLDGEPVFASIITDELNGDRTIFSYMPENSSDQFIEKLPIDLSEFDIALFDGFFHEMSRLILKELKKHKVSTVLDGGSWKPGIEKILPYIDIAVLSNDFRPPLCETKYEAINCLQSYYIKQIAITNGNNSIVIYDDKIFHEIPVPKVQVKDTLGAGDIFHGAFCFYYACNNDLLKALKEAADVAAYSCKSYGTRNWIKDFNLVNI
jgi:sugar/nucleoside kinase (ribokinase family)